MNRSFEQIFQDVQTWAEVHGIAVQKTELAPGKAGEFDGCRAVMNSAYEPEELVFYLTHALGSIICWSLDQASIQQLFDELRAAKQQKASNSIRLERAIRAYQRFEIESSEYAVMLLTEVQGADVVPSYTNFMRADLDALTEFHRHGKAPVWHEFFERWNAEVGSGRRKVWLFQPRPLPPFQPVKIDNQEILQRQEEESSI